jgi:hypothetical protein
MELEERLRRAGGSAEELSTVLFDVSEQVLLALLDNPRLTDEHLGVLLSRKNLSQAFLRELGLRERLLRDYRVKLALVRHPRAPRNVALTLMRHLYLFDLLKVGTTPGVAAEVRRVAEEAVVMRLTALSLGERLSLARLGSGRIAAALLADAEARVYCSALENPRLTEEGVVKILREEKLTPEAVEAIAVHPRWSLRYEVRLGLIRNPATSLGRVLALAAQVRSRDLADLTMDSRMPSNRRKYLARLARFHGTRRRNRLHHSSQEPGAFGSPEQMV